MRLSMIFELLLILLLVAFAAYGRVIGKKNKFKKKISDEEKESKKINFMKIWEKDINFRLHKKYRQNAMVTFGF